MAGINVRELFNFKKDREEIIAKYESEIEELKKANQNLSEHNEYLESTIGALSKSQNAMLELSASAYDDIQNELNEAVPLAKSINEDLGSELQFNILKQGGELISKIKNISFDLVNTLTTEVFKPRTDYSSINYGLLNEYADIEIEKAKLEGETEKVSFMEKAVELRKTFSEKAHALPLDNAKANLLKTFDTGIETAKAKVSEIRNNIFNKNVAFNKVHLPRLDFIKNALDKGVTAIKNNLDGVVNEDKADKYSSHIGLGLEDGATKTVYHTVGYELTHQPYSNDVNKLGQGLNSVLDKISNVIAKTSPVCETPMLYKTTEALTVAKDVIDVINDPSAKADMETVDTLSRADYSKINEKVTWLDNELTEINTKLQFSKVVSNDTIENVKGQMTDIYNNIIEEMALARTYQSIMTHTPELSADKKQYYFDEMTNSLLKIKQLETEMQIAKGCKVVKTEILTPAVVDKKLSPILWDKADAISETKGVYDVDLRKFTSDLTPNYVYELSYMGEQGNKISIYYNEADLENPTRVEYQKCAFGNNESVLVYDKDSERIAYSVLANGNCAKLLEKVPDVLESINRNSVEREVFEQVKDKQLLEQNIR